jgi:hypothetical protein
MGLSNILGSPTKHHPSSQMSLRGSEATEAISTYVVALFSNDLKPASRADAISVPRPQSPVSHLTCRRERSEAISTHVVALFSNDLKPAPRADVISVSRPQSPVLHPPVVALLRNDLKPAPRADLCPPSSVPCLSPPPMSLRSIATT